MECIACRKSVQWYHKKGANSSWHKHCWELWSMGYEARINFENGITASFKLPSIEQMYWAIQITSPSEKLKEVMRIIKEAGKESSG